MNALQLLEKQYQELQLRIESLHLRLQAQEERLEFLSARLIELISGEDMASSSELKRHVWEQWKENYQGDDELFSFYNKQQ